MEGRMYEPRLHRNEPTTTKGFGFVDIPEEPETGPEAPAETDSADTPDQDDDGAKEPRPKPRHRSW